MPGVDNVPFLTNAGILNLDVMSEHLAVVSGSYVGLKFSQTHRRFGSRVTVVEQGDRLVAREDENISVTLQQILEAEGIDIRLSATCIGLRRTTPGRSSERRLRAGGPEIDSTHVLLAVGHRPNTDDLGFDVAGIATDERSFITLDDRCRTNVPGV